MLSAQHSCIVNPGCLVANAPLGLHRWAPNLAQVWWEGDQCFYPGLVALFDPVATE